MARYKTGGVQKGFKKYGEQTLNLAGRIPTSLYKQFEEVPGTKTDKLIEAIREFVQKER